MIGRSWTSDYDVPFPGFVINGAAMVMNLFTGNLWYRSPANVYAERRVLFVARPVERLVGGRSE